VPGTGLEPARLAALDPKSSASANSAIPARLYMLLLNVYPAVAASISEPPLELGRCGS
jgi:hypothetical protein